MILLPKINTLDVFHNRTWHTIMLSNSLCQCTRRLPSPWEIDISEGKKRWVTGSINLSDGHFLHLLLLMTLMTMLTTAFFRTCSTDLILHEPTVKVAENKRRIVKEKKTARKKNCKKRSRKKKKKVECKFWMALTVLRTTPLPYCLFHSSAGLKKWSKINRSKLYSQASLIFNCTDFVRVNFALPTL